MLWSASCIWHQSVFLFQIAVYEHGFWYKDVVMLLLVVIQGISVCGTNLFLILTKGWNYEWLVRSGQNSQLLRLIYSDGELTAHLLHHPIESVFLEALSIIYTHLVWKSCTWWAIQVQCYSRLIPNQYHPRLQTPGRHCHELTATTTLMMLIAHLSDNLGPVSPYMIIP